MRRPPPSLLIIGVLFLALGCLELYLGMAPLFRAAGHLAGDDVLVLIIGVAALVGGTFLLRGHSWARGLLAVWLALHVVLSIGAPMKLVAHLVIFSVIVFFLFRPAATAFLQPPPA